MLRSLVDFVILVRIKRDSFASANLLSFLWFIASRAKATCRYREESNTTTAKFYSISNFVREENFKRVP